MQAGSMVIKVSHVTISLMQHMVRKTSNSVSYKMYELLYV